MGPKPCQGCKELHLRQLHASFQLQFHPFVLPVLGVCCGLGFPRGTFGRTAAASTPGAVGSGVHCSVFPPEDTASIPRERRALHFEFSLTLPLSKLSFKGLVG